MADTIRAKGRLGIVTVLYGSHDVVTGFFGSLALQEDVDFKVYIVDNSPTSDTLELCQALVSLHGIDAEFIRNNANLGVAKGNNQGIENALRDGCAGILLANNDTEFESGTLMQLVNEWMSGAMTVTPKLLYYGQERLIWFAGGRINSWTMRTPHLGHLEFDGGQYDTPCNTGYAPTCFLLIDATVFARIGYMDETYFVYYDDTDFIWRVVREGIKIRYAPKAVVLHKVSTSTGGAASPFTIYYTNRNRIYFIRKNLRGLRRAVALTYTLTTRLMLAATPRRVKSASMWKGIRDGMNLKVPYSTSEKG